MRVLGPRRGIPPGSPAAFLDRDGTLNRNIPGEYITSPGQIELYARVPAALKLLSRKGYRLVIITNQSAIGRGYMTAETSRAINARLVSMLRREGVEIDAVYCCPHTPEARCGCRKPAAGLLREAARDLKLAVSASFVAGDKKCDMQLADNAGLKGYLVLTGGGRKAASRAAAYRDILSVAAAVPDLSNHTPRRKK